MSQAANIGSSKQKHLSISVDCLYHLPQIGILQYFGITTPESLPCLEDTGYGLNYKALISTLGTYAESMHIPLKWIQCRETVPTFTHSEMNSLWKDHLLCKQLILSPSAPTFQYSQRYVLVLHPSKRYSAEIRNWNEIQIIKVWEIILFNVQMGKMEGRRKRWPATKRIYSVTMAMNVLDM